MSGVTLSSITKKYGEVQVIHGIDLEIKDGEFCVFVGPSGCGKSTLLRMVAGLEDTTGGAISIGTRDVTREDPARRGVAMVFQTYALYPHMTVQENMGFGLRMNGHPKHEIAQKVAEASRILKLDDYLKRKPAALSGGQRQRVSIGRAIVRGPEVFLFDEPLSNLDAELRVEGIEQVGAPMDVYRDPDNKFVAGFIGSPAMNFLSAVVKNGAVDVPGLETAVDLPVTLPADGTAVEIGLRPEHLTLDPKGRTHRIEMTESLGGVSYAYLKGATGERIVVEERGETRSTEGDRVGLIPDSASARLFDAASEIRIR